MNVGFELRADDSDFYLAVFGHAQISRSLHQEEQKH